MCHYFHGEINVAQCLQGLLLDHIIEEATGAAVLHKGKGNTSSTEGHKEEKRVCIKEEKQRARGRQVGGGETQLFHLYLCISSLCL